MNATSRITFPPETDAERRARQLDTLREIEELGMDMARDAAARAKREPAQTPDPALSFARVTRAVRQAIVLETRVAAGDLVRERRTRPTPDPRRTLLREALHQAAATEPDRAYRAELKRDIDEAVEHELRADPEARIPLPDMLVAISDRLGLTLQLSKLRDEVLGIEFPSRQPFAVPPQQPHYHPRE